MLFKFEEHAKEQPPMNYLTRGRIHQEFFEFQSTNVKGENDAVTQVQFNGDG
jgi:hypothetical protein